jgi:monovalent cation:H+ antiporter-2, CPA2 family
MELSILQDIVIMFALSTLVNFIFTKIRVPTVIGYLLTGIIAGPHLFGVIKLQHDIELMAEIGVVLLMFTIGMEFSLKHLLRIRRIVFLGGLLQVTFSVLAFFAASRIYGVDVKGSIFIGFLTALSSSALVLKVLQERSELTSNYGRTVLGILIFQDILLVPLILVTQMMGSETVNMMGEIYILLVKVIGIIGFVYIGNKWLLPKLLHYIAMTKNQELFMMSILFICLAIALLTSALGMSLAFGAFLAGLMISESEYSHNAFGNIVIFKDTFTSFFFVSIGMLLDLQFIAEQWTLVLGTVALVILIKAIIAGGTGFLLGHTFRGTVIVGLALSQVGEFSFILAKIGLESSIFSDFYYQLFLATAVITMSASPFLIQAANPLASLLLKLPIPEWWVKGIFPLPEIKVPEMKGHLVIIGKDLRAQKLSLMVDYHKMPYVSIVFDPSIARDKITRGEMAIYGDAVNGPILQKAYADKADIVAISVGDIIASMAIVEKVRQINPQAFILVRAKHLADMEELYKLGANHVVPEIFETAIEMFSRILSKKLLPKRVINKALAQIREDYYGIFREKNMKNMPNILDDLPNIEINAFKIDENSPVIGRSLFDVHLRKNTGATLLAINRNEKIIEHPSPDIVFEKNDITYILGRPEQIASAYDLLARERENGERAGNGNERDDLIM